MPGRDRAKIIRALFAAYLSNDRTAIRAFATQSSSPSKATGSSASRSISAPIIGTAPLFASRKIEPGARLVEPSTLYFGARAAYCQTRPVLTNSRCLPESN
jgi:hypothetical protein